MRRAAMLAIRKSIRRAIPLVICGFFLGSAAHAQSGNAGICEVTRLRLTIATADDDLRGGKDNLNVVIYFANHDYQLAPNVNHSQNWPNNSTNTVGITLKRPIPPNEISGLRLIHIPDGGFNLSISPELATLAAPFVIAEGFQSPDNWHMGDIEIAALGSGFGAQIGHHGYHSFTGSDPALSIRTQAPANVCGSGGSRFGRLTPGARPAMIASAGTPRPGSPARKLTPQQISAIAAKVHATAGKSGPVVSNPGAGGSDISTLGVLRQQKQVAMTERSLPSPTTPTPTATARTAAMTRAPALRGPISTTAAPPPPSPANRGVMMTQPNVNVACGTFNAPMITTVSGQQGSTAVFTQDPQFNPFTIRGCNFGNAKGQAQLNFSNGRKLTNLIVDTWTSSLITVEIPSQLIGVLDETNVTLVLFPTNGPQAQRSGFKFYARRAEMHLASIPASAVTLTPITDAAGSPVAAKFSSPYLTHMAGAGGQASGTVSGGVDRINIVRFPGGTDTFDFSRLKPGFSVEKYQVKELSFGVPDGCGGIIVGNDNYYTDGSWGWQMTGNTIRVTWQESHDHSDQCSEDGSDASYGLDVWLIGPVLSPGQSPWQDGVQ